MKQITEIQHHKCQPWGTHMPPVTGVSLNNSTNTLISTGTVFVLQYKLKKNCERGIIIYNVSLKSEIKKAPFLLLKVQFLPQLSK